MVNKNKTKKEAKDNKRPKQYNSTLKVNGNFLDVIKAVVKDSDNKFKKRS